jgi:hypothetical protein
VGELIIMKTKILTTIVILILLFTTVNVVSTGIDGNEEIEIAEKEDHILFSQVKFETKGEYISVNIDEANTYLNSAGKPMLPVYSKIFTFPYGTKIKNVECQISDIKSKTIDSKIEPAPKPVLKISLNNNQKIPIEKTDDNNEIIVDKNEIIEDQSVYSSSNLFPDKWYDYKILCGLNNGKDTIFVKVNSYPLRYSPAENTLYSIDSIDIRVTYEEGRSQIRYDTEYDLLIITPRWFYLWLLPLYFHKTKMGVATKIVTVESIYAEGFEGDKPEQIKRFIAKQKEDCNITYVLLLGGLRSYWNAKDKDNINEGSTGWYVPVRYVNLIWKKNSFISDLYYGDLYRYNESSGKDEFNNWNPNGNEFIADEDEFSELDLIPDIYYGRLPCRSIFDVRRMVKKIINYEKPTIFGRIFGKPWMKKMIAVSGRNVPSLSYEGELDGEWLCNRSIDNMSDVITNSVKIYSSNLNTNRPTPIWKDIVREYRKGAGFAHFEGHGNAFIWDTHWPEWGEKDGMPHWENWTGGIISFLHFPRLLNGKKLPVVVVGGCHNAIFNVSFIKTLADNASDTYDSNYHGYGIPVRSCFCWSLLNRHLGGAIGIIGSTDFGLGGATPMDLSGGLDFNFFYIIGHNAGNDTFLGNSHGNTITKYLVNDIGEMEYADAYVVTQFQLFGDPSLKIGGY